MIARAARPPLSQYVAAIWAVNGYVAGPHRHEWMLPSGQASLIVHLGAPAWDPIVSGPHSKAFELSTEAQFAVAGVVFKPGGLYPFVTVPVGELANTHVELSDLWGGLAAELNERMRSVSTLEQQVDLLEGVLTERLARGRPLRPEIRWAAAAFDHDPAAANIARVIDQAGMSHRRFLDLFTAEVGLTPKLFCRLRRFRRALDRVAAERIVNWTGLAVECGYYDQAHFNHDFRAFAGMTPTMYEKYRVSQNHVAILD
jgi:AraC-like DNA-binding protein